VTDHPNLATALAAFQAEMPVVSKTKRNNFGTYADLAGVTEAAMPLLSKHGLSFTSKPKVTPQGVVLRGVLRHTSGEKDVGTLPVHGNQPQQIGSSLTYMRRYLLGCLTGIVTEDDDDGAAAQKTRARKAADAPQDAPQDAAEAPPATRRMSRPTSSPDESLSAAQRTALHVAFNEIGIADRDQRLAYTAERIGHSVKSSNELTRAEASTVLYALQHAGEPQ
jgi:hypothetical protein